jgi:serine protease AprX
VQLTLNHALEFEPDAQTSRHRAKEILLPILHHFGEVVRGMTTHPDRTFTPPRLRRMFCSFFFLAAAIAALAAIGSFRATGQGGPAGPGGTANKIAPWVLDHTVNRQQAEFMVVLVDQADLRPAEALATKNEKGRYVYDALWNKSQTTQGSILQWLRERDIEHRSFYIINAVLVKGSREIAGALAARPDVARVEGNPQIKNVLPQPIPAVEAPSQPQTPETVGPGINYTHAPQVWAVGFTGQGIVIGSADTGVRWTHSALKRHYRGWNGTTANHDYNWHDSIHNSTGNPCGNNAHAPCDDHGHGTHTIGTATGDDGAGNQIGMAPGAKWIGCRNMDQANGTPARYIECMQFFLAPYPVGGTPAQGDPTLAPDITTNSWGCPPWEGCSANTLQAAVEAQRAAGIMMVVAAGNEGPSCSTLFYPPSFYQASYTVGALTTGTDTIASLSSRGPVTIDGSNRLKPEITAPGTGIRSSVNTSDIAYASFSGTSMATPHIAGAVALLWSARSELRRNIAASRTVLNDAAVHILSGVCNGGNLVTPNNTYGHGRIDILAAVTAPAVTDFNRDSKPDYLLYNAGTRKTAVWYLNNNAFIGGAFAPTLPVGWRVIDVADFNRDGRPDYALFNASTRQSAIWYLSGVKGVTFIGSAWGPILPGGWALVATGEFNNDGKPDYVIFNASTRQTAIWYLNNNMFIGGAYGPSIPAGWSLVGIADFNRDGKPDYLLFNPSTHYSVIWYLSGATRIGSAFGPTIAAGYNLIGTSDFNRDGKPDYLLFNPSTRGTAIWYLNNNVRIATAVGPTLAAGYTLAAP